MSDDAALNEALDIHYCLTCSRIHTSFCYLQNLNNLLSTNSFFDFHYLFLISKCLCHIFNFAHGCFNKFVKKGYTQPVWRVPKWTLNDFCSKCLGQGILQNFIFQSSKAENFRRLVVPRSNILVNLQEEDADNQQNSSKPVKNTKTEILSSSSALSVTSRVSGGRLSNSTDSPKKEELINSQLVLSQKTTTCSSSYSETDHEGRSTLQEQKTSNKEMLSRKRFSRSKIPLRKTKRTIMGEESEELISAKTYQKSSWFIRKFKYRPANRLKSIGSSTVDSPSTEKIPQSSQSGQTVIRSNSSVKNEEKNLNNLSKELSDAEDSCLKSCSSYTVPQFHSSFFAPLQPSLDLRLTDALREVLELTSRLREDEAHVAHVITKYIQDRTLEKELLDRTSNHAKLHLEAERRAQNLANEMWLQQMEMMKNQETELQENLGILVKENRKLQEEIENVTKKNEKLSVRLNQFPEKRGLIDTSNQVLENLSRNNDKLRYKTSILLAQIEEHEKDVSKMHRKDISMEQQLRNSNSQLQNYKAMLRRMQTDHELEYAHLSHQLQTDELTIKESVEAGDILLEDLDGLKRQLKTMPCSLNWTKLKSRGNSLPDLIYMCRSCINELTKELLNSQTEMMLRDKDNTTLKEELLRMENDLEASKSEQGRLNKDLEETRKQEVDLKVFSSRYSKLEREFGDYKNATDKLVEKLEKERASLVASSEELDVLNRQVIERNEELTLNKEKMVEYKSENDTLRMQIHGLKQVLNASGTGDVARELADTQEKLTFFQSQYYQLLSEKNYLVEQLQSANLERGALNEFQNSYYQYLQAQQQDLDALNKENTTLKEQLETERGRVSALRTERGKLKEEKAVMKEIYHQLKTEISKVQKLEGEVVGMNMEANRLAIIAEYNKQLGEKLQCEVVERDVKISKLQNNMEELNNAQMENVKDKVALCVELTEVCTINDKLNHSLATEHQKTVHLDKTKKKFEETASSQLKAVEEMQKVERAALRELLKDYKNVVAQRDNLLTAQNEYLQQISDLQSNTLAQTRNIEVSEMKRLQNMELVTEFEEKLKITEGELNRLGRENVKLEKFHAHQQIEIQELKSQNEAFDSTIKYLQNVIQKLHDDLNDSRKTEMETKKVLEKESKKRQDLEEVLEQGKTTLINISQENQKLKQHVLYLEGTNEKLLADYKQNMEKSIETNEDLQKKLEKAKAILETRSEDVERLEHAFAEKEMEVVELQQYCDGLAEQLKQMEQSEKDIEEQSKLLSESHTAQVHLQEALTALQREHEKCTEIITTLNEEKQQLQGKLKEHIQEMEVECSHYRNYIEEIMKEHIAQKNEMQVDLQSLAQKLQEMNSEYLNEKTIHAKLLESHKDLANKLLKAVRMLVDEKLNRQGAEVSITNLSQKNLQLSSEKAAAENTIALLSDELKDLKSRFEDLTTDKKSIQSVLCDLQELQKQTRTRYQASEQELQQLRINSNSCSNTTFIWRDPKNKLEAVAEEHTRQLKDELNDGHRKIMELTVEISNLKQELTIMEFQKSEVILRLHEIQAKLKTEQNMAKELLQVNQRIIAEILSMENTGKVSQEVCETLLQIVQVQEREVFLIEE